MLIFCFIISLLWGPHSISFVKLIQRLSEPGFTSLHRISSKQRNRRSRGVTSMRSRLFAGARSLASSTREYNIIGGRRGPHGGFHPPSESWSLKKRFLSLAFATSNPFPFQIYPRPKGSPYIGLPPSIFLYSVHRCFYETRLDHFNFLSSLPLLGIIFLWLLFSIFDWCQFLSYYSPALTIRTSKTQTQRQEFGSWRSYELVVLRKVWKEKKIPVKPERHLEPLNPYSKSDCYCWYLLLSSVGLVAKIFDCRHQYHNEAVIDSANFRS